MRFALGVDDDLRPFYERFRDDPLIGRVACARGRGCASARRPEPFEALAWAICEQLIEYERAAAIERRHRRAARAAAARGTRACATCPTPRRSRRRARAAGVASTSAPARALALRRAAREVARGPRRPARARPRARLARGCGRSRASARGRSRCSRCTARAATTSCPAGDLAYLQARRAPAARAHPRARADEDEVREFFAPYGRLGRARRRRTRSRCRGPGSLRATAPSWRRVRRRALARQELVRQRRAGGRRPLSRSLSSIQSP